MAQPLKIYFDTNVLLNLFHKNLDKIKGSVLTDIKKGKIKVLYSPTSIDEFLSPQKPKNGHKEEFIFLSEIFSKSPEILENEYKLGKSLVPKLEDTLMYKPMHNIRNDFEWIKVKKIKDHFQPLREINEGVIESVENSLNTGAPGQTFHRSKLRNDYIDLTIKDPDSKKSSSAYDFEHLFWVIRNQSVDYFITGDLKMIKKGKKLLFDNGIETEILTSDEWLQRQFKVKKI